ncbi:MAG: stage 0 sporulation family protein [Christensenellaceae bacterium]|nr:stage 0 sporulation family protein [Christensenellaceae bacterium]
MAEVIGVRFKKAGKVYYFDPKGIEFAVGDGAIVETVRGVEFGNVVIAPRQVSDKEITKPLKQVLRKATEKDLRRIEENKKKEKQAFKVCEEKIRKHKMEMKLINVEYTFDNNKIVFYFTADGRVDFRDLVKDLAGVFKTRIELRQIGVRDESKMIGGLGPCGRPACCAVFLGDFQPVSIKMAKEQNLSLSPTKISGLCGRLMCCLNYEHEYYEEIAKVMPRVNSEVKTPDGKGIVLDTNALKQTVRVKVMLEGDDFDVKEFPLSEITVLRHGKKKKKEEAAISDELKALQDS